MTSENVGGRSVQMINSWRLGGSIVCLLGLALTTAAYAQPPATRPSTRRADEGGSANALHSTPNDVHRLIRDDPVSFADSSPTMLTSRVIETDFPYNDLLVSWNVDVPAGSGFVAQIRLHRLAGEWTPFYYLGTWGAGPRLQKTEKIVNDENGWVNLDYFQSRNQFDRIQYRFLLSANPDGQAPVPQRVGLACSNTLNDAELARKYRQSVDPGPREKWARRLPVPFRSQNWEADNLRGLICSPTSVSMVLEYRGIKLPTTEVCATIYDAEHRMYGNWWRAVQGAYMYGVPGYIERFGDWNAVKRHIAAGQPIIASIRAERGEISTMPNRVADGHLIVVAGFDENEDVLVNDPALRTAELGKATYRRADMDKIWLAHGGVGYILLPRK